MRVVWRQQGRGRGGEDDEVVFEVLSIARGSGPLGRLVFPFNRGMQVSAVSFEFVVYCVLVGLYQSCGVYLR